MKGWIAAFLWLGWAVCMQAAVTIDGSREVYELGGAVEVLEDKTGQMTLEVARQSDGFVASRGIHASYGFTHSAYWARTTLHNATDRAQRFLLVQREQSLDFWDVHLLRGDKPAQTWLLGDRRPLEAREYPHRYSIAPIELAPGETATLYMRHQASQAIILSMALFSEAAFAKNEAIETLWFGIGFGIMGVMALYNLFVWLVIRERAYLYYVAYVGSQLVMQFVVISGFAYWLLPSLPLSWYSEIYLYAQNALIFFTVLFTMNFLETRTQAPKLNRILQIIAVLAVVFMAAHAIHYHPAIEQINLLIGLVSVAVMLVTGVRLWLKKFPAAKFYTIAWVFYLLGTMVSLLGFMGFYGVDFWIKTAMASGTALEVTLISLALAEKFRILREEREAAVHALMEQSQKNARQEQLLVQQSKMAEIGHIFGMVAHQWKQPLNAIALVSQNLRDESAQAIATPESIADDTQRIEKQVNYMARTITDFQNFLKPGRQKLPFDLSTALKEVIALIEPVAARHRAAIRLQTEAQAPIEGFKNEFMQVVLNLINNAIESIAQSGRAGEIGIALHKEADRYRLEIQDNGAGLAAAMRGRIFEQFASTKGEKGTGLGLYMARMIIEEKMGGKVALEGLENGVKVQIELPLGAKD